MAGEEKTLKQIQAARSVVRDAMDLLETFSLRQDRNAESRFIYAAMTITRRRLEEVQSGLTDAQYRAHMSLENTAVVSKDLFEDVRLFRTIGPAQLSSLLKNRQLHRILQDLAEDKKGLGEPDQQNRDAKERGGNAETFEREAE
jgi:hypothetical protein